MRISMHVALAALVLMTSGCGLAGMGIGSAIPRYEPISRADVKTGDEIRVGVASLANEPVVDLSGRPGLVTGRYLGDARGELVVETDEGPRRFPPSELSKLEIRRGSEWKRGLIVGAGIDVLVVVMVIAVTASSRYEFSGLAVGAPIMR